VDPSSQSKIHSEGLNHDSKVDEKAHVNRKVEFQVKEPTLVIGIRGTASSQDALTDVLTETMIWDPNHEVQAFLHPKVEKPTTQTTSTSTPTPTSTPTSSSSPFWKSWESFFTNWVSYFIPEEFEGGASGHVEASPDHQGYCHAGMGQSAIWLYHRLRSRIVEQVLKFESTRKAHDGHMNIVVTGHSLGAGCSSLLGLLLEADPFFKEHSVRIRTFAFASPQIVTKEIASKVDKERFLTINNMYDVVPRASMATTCCLFEECIRLDEHREDFLGRVLKDFEEVKEEAERLITLKFLDENEKRLSIKELFEKRIQELELKRSQFGKLYSIGEIIVLSENPVCKSVTAMHPDDLDMFQTIVMSSTMLKDHFLETYIHRIDSLLKDTKEEHP